MAIAAKRAFGTGLCRWGIGAVLGLAGMPMTVADEVIMQNGDRLTGEVVTQSKNTIRFKTSYAGTISIKWDQISELKMDEPEALLMEDESVLEVVGVKREDDQVTVTPVGDEAEVTVGASEVAELAPEPWRIGRGGKFSGNVNASIEIESGNSDSEEFDLDFDLTYRRKHDRFKSHGDLETDSSNGLQTKQNWSVTAKYDRFINEDLYYSFAAGFKQEKYADLDLRTTVGPTLGYQFFESEERNLLAELGVLWVNENFIVDADQNYWGPGWRIEYDHVLIEDRMQFYHRQLGSQSVTGEGGLLWRAWTGFRFPIWNGFVLSTEYEIDYDGEPASGADQADNTFRLKLGYEW